MDYVGELARLRTMEEYAVKQRMSEEVHITQYVIRYTILDCRTCKCYLLLKSGYVIGTELYCKMSTSCTSNQLIN